MKETEERPISLPYPERKRKQTATHTKRTGFSFAVRFRAEMMTSCNSFFYSLAKDAVAMGEFGRRRRKWRGGGFGGKVQARPLTSDVERVTHMSLL